MTAKDYVLQVLDRVGNERDIAPGLKVLIQHGDINTEVLDALVTIFSQVIKNIGHKQDTSKLEKAVDVIRKIQEQEKVDHEKDIKDLNELDDMIAHM